MRGRDLFEQAFCTLNIPVLCNNTNNILILLCSYFVLSVQTDTCIIKTYKSAVAMEIIMSIFYQPNEFHYIGQL